jgi:hypothetical protein
LFKKKKDSASYGNHHVDDPRAAYKKYQIGGISEAGCQVSEYPQIL